MSRNSPARAHFQRSAAAARQAATTSTTRADATAYELMLAKLAADKRRLHDIQSIERRAEVKLQLLPEYQPWIEGVLAGGHGVQDDVLMTVMVWRVDVGDLSGALDIAEYAVMHKLAMPDQYKRTTGCLIAEEFADYAMRQKDGIGADMTTALQGAQSVTVDEDMPDEVRAKLQKAIGYGLDRAGDKSGALEHLRLALALHDKCGVKKDIERLEREIKNKASPPAASGAAG